MSDATTVAEAPAKKSGRGLMVIILAALVAAAVAGGTAYYFAAGKEKAATAEAKAAQRTGKPKAPPVYVKLEPPFVANFEAKGLVRFLQVSVEVMTRDPATSELLKQHDPRIRNDLLMLLGNQQYESISTHAGKEKLRGEALEVVKKIIVAEGGKASQVEQLYFTSFVMQ